MPVELLTAEFRQKLVRHDGPVELCGFDGELVGYFTPARPKRYDFGPEISKEELDRRYAEPGGRTWAEIKADLEKRG